MMPQSPQSLSPFETPMIPDSSDEGPHQPDLVEIGLKHEDGEASHTEAKNPRKRLGHGEQQ